MGTATRAKELTAQLRDFVLQGNSNGCFPRIGITPRVFAPGFEDRVRSLVELQAERLNGGMDSIVSAGYHFRDMGKFTDGFLRLQVVDTRNHRHATVDLLSFSRQVAHERFFVELLSKTEAKLQEFFPNAVATQQMDTITNIDNNLIMEAPRRYARLQNRSWTATRRQCDSKLSAALEKYRRNKEAPDEAENPVINACVDVAPEVEICLPLAVPIGAGIDSKRSTNCEIVDVKKEPNLMTIKHQHKVTIALLIVGVLYVWLWL